MISLAVRVKDKLLYPAPVVKTESLNRIYVYYRRGKSVLMWKCSYYLVNSYIFIAETAIYIILNNIYIYFRFDSLHISAVFPAAGSRQIFSGPEKVY
jgi:hypothetical protein